MPHLEVISRAVGVGTRWLDGVREGQSLNLTGPLGHAFDIPAEENAPLVLIGGGVGIPPLLYLARRLRELGRADVTVIFGATTRDLLPVSLAAAPAADGTPTACLELPGGAGFAAAVTTDDGSVGLHGVVTDALALWHRARGAGTARAVVYACGPDGMLRALARQTRELGYACQLCIERMMGCGLGTCQSCVTRLRDPARETGWRWGLACSDGPVFDRDALFDY